MHAWLDRLRRSITAPDPYLLLLLALTIPALAPLLSPGYFFDAHDGRHSVFYLEQFDAGLRDGALWPRWAMHHIQGYGYPTFIIQAPLGFYVADLFVWLGAGLTTAVKLTWALGFLVSAWGMYTLVRVWLDRTDAIPTGPGGSPSRHRTAALVAGLLYVYAPYHLAEIYVRAALNDTLLMAWFPWVFLAFDRLIAPGGRAAAIDRGSAAGWPRRLAWASLSLAGCLLTHSFALISFAPLIVLFALFRLALAHTESAGQPRPEGTRWAALLRRGGLAAAGGTLALLIFAAFLIPLLVEGPLLEQQVYVTNTYDYRNHFVQWGQFFSPFWGFGFSDDPSGANDGMGFQAGVLLLILALLAGYVLLTESEPRGLRRAYLGCMAVLSLALLVAMTPSAAAVWASLPPLAIIQFPWRLLALAVFTLAAVAGLGLPALLGAVRPVGEEDLSRAAAALLGLLIMLASAPYIQANLSPVEPWREDGRAVARFEQEHPDMIAYTTYVKEPFTTSAMTDDYAAEDYVEVHGATTSLDRLTILRGEGKVVSTYSRGSSAGGVVRVTGPATVQIGLYYFPGWRVRVDGVEVAPRVSDPHGLIEVDVPAGEHSIDARMGATPARTTGAVLAWTALLVVVGLLVWPVRRDDAA
jgi:hypothetical protein